MGRCKSAQLTASELRDLRPPGASLPFPPFLRGDLLPLFRPSGLPARGRGAMDASRGDDARGSNGGLGGADANSTTPFLGSGTGMRFAVEAICGFTLSTGCERSWCASGGDDALCGVLTGSYSQADSGKYRLPLRWPDGQELVFLLLKGSLPRPRWRHSQRPMRKRTTAPATNPLAIPATEASANCEVEDAAALVADGAAEVLETNG